MNVARPSSRAPRHTRSPSPNPNPMSRPRSNPLSNPNPRSSVPPPRVGRPRARRRSLDWQDDSGQVGGIEVLPFSILIFVVGSLLVAQAWAAIDVKVAVNAASREAARAFVEAGDAGTGVTDADRVAREAIAGHGRDPARLVIDAPDFHGGGYTRCQQVTIHVSYPVPALSLPLIGTHGEAYRASSSHTEIIDPYRSGGAATGGC